MITVNLKAGVGLGAKMLFNASFSENLLIFGLEMLFSTFFAKIS